MRHLKTLTAAVAILAASAGLAGAADLTNGGGLKDSASNPNIWSGFYAELGVGPGFSQTSVSGVATLAATGTEFDFRLGYDRALVNHILVGVYGDVGNNFDVNGTAYGISFGNRWTYGGGVKAAYDYDTGQVYAIAGYAHQDVGFTGWSSGLDGFKWGGGIQMKIFGPHLYTGLEATQTLYNPATTPIILGSSFKFTDTNDEVKAKLGWKF